MYDFGIAFDIEDRLLELGADGVDGFEGVVLEDFLADFIPEIFLGVELWRIGRQEEQRDIIGKREVATAMVGGAVENQENILPGKFPRQDVEEGLTAVKRAVRGVRPDPVASFEVRFETAPGEQAQVDLTRFEVEFTDEPGVKRIVWLFSLVLGYSRLIWGRFVVHQDMQSVLRCHIAALEAIGGAPRRARFSTTA